DTTIRQAIEAWEPFELDPRQRLQSPFDDFGFVMDRFESVWNEQQEPNEAGMAMWLIFGWWPEVKSFWGQRELPESWRSLIHDVFGDHFCSKSVDPRWLTSTVTDLAKAIYEQASFDRMPILADALMDAGCDNE